MIFFILFLANFFSNDSYCNELNSLYMEIESGSVFINSKSLNKITEGYNTGYATNFNSIHYPYIFSAGFGIEKYKWSLGLVFSMEYNSKTSYSDVFEFSEKIKLYNYPIYFKFRYLLWKQNLLSLYINFGFGFFYSNLSLQAIPEINNNAAYVMSSSGILTYLGVSSDYNISDKIDIFLSIDFRLAKSSLYRYSVESFSYFKDDPVIFSDGSDLTLNLTGIKFILGIKFKWGIK